jgi:hypothetical protein
MGSLEGRHGVSGKSVARRLLDAAFVAGQMDAQGWAANRAEPGSGDQVLRISRTLLAECEAFVHEIDGTPTPRTTIRLVQRVTEQLGEQLNDDRLRELAGVMQELLDGLDERQEIAHGHPTQT